MVDVAKVPAGPKIREWSRKHGFDDWMVARWVKLLQGAPPGSLNKFLEGIRRKAPEYIRANPLRCSGTELERRLDARGFKLAPVELDPQMRRVVHAPISAGATISGSIKMAIGQLRSLKSGARKTASPSPIRHSRMAVSRPKRSENQLARQKPLSVKTAAKLPKPEISGLRSVSKLMSETE